MLRVRIPGGASSSTLAPSFCETDRHWHKFVTALQWWRIHFDCRQHSHLYSFPAWYGGNRPFLAPFGFGTDNPNLTQTWHLHKFTQASRCASAEKANNNIKHMFFELSPHRKRSEQHDKKKTIVFDCAELRRVAEEAKNLIKLLFLKSLGFSSALC